MMWPTIKSLPFVEHYEHFSSIASTNTYAAQHPFVVHSGIALFVTDVQEAGRGQRFNTFFSSSPHGLWVTLTVAVPSIADHFLVNRALSCAIAGAVKKRSSGHTTAIKWPNDIYLNNKKIGGILLQSVDGQPNTIAAGFGINANLSTNEFSEELRMIATSLWIETGREHSREELLHDILTAFNHNLHRPTGEIHAVYASMLWRLGAQVAINNKEGLFDGVGTDGRLCLRVGNEREYIVAGILKFL